MNEQLIFDFDNALPEWAESIAVFDLETTGLDLKTARIVTACAVEINSAGQIIGKNQEWLANPGIDIPEAASNVHGVTTQMAREQGRNPEAVISEILETISGFLARGIPVVAYNAPYDFTILHYEAMRYNLDPLVDPKPIIDPLVMDKFVDQYRPGKRTLEVVAKIHGISLSEAHNATADAVAAGRVAQAIIRKYADKLPNDLNELHQAQVEWSAKQDDGFESFKRRTNPDFTIQRGWPIKL
jgi:DNA polymerase-3 subunit epsilon